MMLRKAFAAWTILAGLAASPVSAAIINVPADQLTVTAAIAAANPNDTINISAPHIEGAAIIVNKNLFFTQSPAASLTMNDMTISATFHTTWTGVTINGTSANAAVTCSGTGEFYGCTISKTSGNGLVVRQNNAAATSILDNTIVQGSVNSAGVQCNNGLFRIRNNSIIRNNAGCGVRTQASDGNLQVSDSLIQNNGAGVFNIANSQVNMNAVGSTITLTNVTIDRGSSINPAIGYSAGAGTAGTITMTGGSIINGSGSTVNAIIDNQTATGAGNITISNVATITNSGTAGTIQSDGGQITVNNSTLSGATTVFSGTGPINLNDCQLASGASNLISNLGTQTININRPTFVGQCGVIMIGNPASATINFTGTSAASKLNFDPAIAAGTILLARVAAGTYSFTDVSASNPSLYRWIDSNGLTLTGNVTLNFTRCSFTNGTAKISAEDAGSPAFGYTINATNSVWAGFSDDIFRMSPFPNTHTGPDNFNLTHVTLLPASRPGGVSQMINAAGSPAGSTMAVNNCAIDAGTQSYPAVFSGAGVGADNVINPPTVDVAFPNGLTGTITGALGLAANGSLTVPGSSLVYTAPSSSVVAVDIDGVARPSGPGDTAADAGAYEETTQVPVELSTFVTE